MLRNADHHARTDLLTFVERKDEVGPSCSCQDAMGAPLPFDGPAKAKQRTEYARRLGGGPLSHAAEKSRSSSGTVSPCSIRSAKTRSARASALATASSRVAP